MDVVCEETVDVDCDRTDSVVNVGFRRVDTSLMILVSGGTEPLPDVVLVVVGTGVGDVVAGNRGTVGWLTEDFLSGLRRGRTSNLPSDERTSHRVQTRWWGKKGECGRLSGKLEQERKLDQFG